jgi:hypothetical protein
VNSRRRNLLIGRGEQLLQDGVWPSSGRTKPEPYSLEQQRSLFVPVLDRLASLARETQPTLTPRGEVAAKLTIHPQFLAKSYFPASLLNSSGLRLIGSRAAEVIPRRMVRNAEPKEMPTATLIVAGTERDFTRASSLLQTADLPAVLISQFNRLERVEPFAAADRKRGLDLAHFDQWAETVLHASFQDRDVVDAFVDRVRELGGEVDRDRARTVGGLTFLPLRIENSAASELIRGIEEFTHLRAIRNMPLLGEDPVDLESRMTRSVEPAPPLPTAPAIDETLRAVIFDGGCTPGLLPWVNSIDAPGVPATTPNNLVHGESVSSAFLFGSIDSAQTTVPRPYCNVDHVRVLPSTATDLRVGDVIDRIINTLTEARDAGEPYTLANLSLGPRMPIVDDDPHEWTVRLDDFLSLGDLFMTVAVGNDGTQGPDLGRIQPPADAVNGFAVAASDGYHARAVRAPYSCLGPGRSPGLVKPDAAAFGGAPGTPFRVVDARAGTIESRLGTSYAAPLALRLAAGVRASVEEDIQPIMLHALLVSRAQWNARLHDQTEVGWGILPESVEDILFSPADEVVVMYQGLIAKGHPIRAAVPLPSGLVASGRIRIGATFAYRAPIDPAHPVNYTRSGLEVRFQPDGVNSSSFFSGTDFDAEQTLRRDALKWETCRHKEKRFDSATLTNPSFLIRYQGREEGGEDGDTVRDPVTGRPLPPEEQPSALPFALVVRIRVPDVTDLAEHVLQQFTVLAEVPLRAEIRV